MYLDTRPAMESALLERTQKRSSSNSNSWALVPGIWSVDDCSWRLISSTCKVWVKSKTRASGTLEYLESSALLLQHIVRLSHLSFSSLLSLSSYLVDITSSQQCLRQPPGWWGEWRWWRFAPADLLLQHLLLLVGQPFAQLLRHALKNPDV